MKFLKKYISEAFKFTQEDHIFEMARIGYVGGYEIYVRTDDSGNIPHMHVRSIDKGKNGKPKFETCIRYDSPRYFLHGQYKDKLNSKERNLFNDFMRSPSDEPEKYATNYELSVSEWNRNNSIMKVVVNRDQEGKIIIPDYTELM